MTLRLPTGADEEAIASQMRQNASTGKNALLARCLKSFGDLPQHRMEALGSRIMTDLTMTDRRLIDRAINQGAPGIDLKQAEAADRLLGSANSGRGNRCRDLVGSPVAGSGS
jgi:hypothetical protein